MVIEVVVVLALGPAPDGKGAEIEVCVWVEVVVEFVVDVVVVVVDSVDVCADWVELVSCETIGFNGGSGMSSVQANRVHCTCIVVSTAAMK